MSEPDSLQGAADGRPEFIVFDTETTGFSAGDDRVLELAMIRVSADGERLGQLTTLLNPQGPVRKTEIHGITDADVADAPTFDQILPDVANMLDGAYLVAHNLPFDERFLRAEFQRAKVRLPEQLPGLCTVKLTDALLLNMDNRKLETCCTTFGIPLDGAHAALVDTAATAALFVSYLELFRRRGVTDLYEVGRQAGWDSPREPLRQTRQREPSGVTPHTRVPTEGLLDGVPLRASDEHLAPFSPPADPAGRESWLAELDTQLKSNTCPQCGGILTRRVRKRDQHVFYGCNGYPECRFTRDGG